jgi:hypothetical protein
VKDVGLGVGEIKEAVVVASVVVVVVVLRLLRLLCLLKLDICSDSG